VVLVEHDMHVIAESDWVVDIGPGAGEDGGKIVAAGIPADIVKVKQSRTAAYLSKYL
jgi:excinuclease ABC subunit A